MILRLLASACLLAVCQSAAAQAPGSGEERFYGRESFTIVSQLTGSETGSVTEHVRDWGRVRSEIGKSTTKIGGMSVARDNRIVYEGAKVTTIDAKTAQITSTTNPFYPTFVSAMKGKDPMKFGEEMMTRMGGRKTGEKANIASHDCEYWTLMSVKTCVTAWGATLHTSSSMAGIAKERKATEVRLGDKGPDAAFAYDASKAKAQPNIQDVLKNIPGRN